MMTAIALVVVIVGVFVVLPIYLYRRYGWNLFSAAITPLMQMFR